MTRRVVWWVKRDARLFDNTALSAAVASGAEVIPLYIEEPLLYEGPDWSVVHTTAYHSALESLNKNLRHYGSALFVRTGDAVSVFEKLKRELAFSAIYSHEETGLNHTFKRDRLVKIWCRESGIAWHEFPTNGVTRGLKDRTHWQAHFTASMSAPAVPIPAPLELSIDCKMRAGRLSVTAAHMQALSPVSERIGHETLKQFLQTRAVGYSGGVSSMLRAPISCSRLSVHLAWGTLSLRTVFQATQKHLTDLPTDGSATQWRRSLRAFQSRLFWHSHFIQRLEDEVGMEYEPLNPAFSAGLPVVVGNDIETRLHAWRTGTTGFPAIDAAVRYYRETGWLNFRSRAMITSFAVHALRLPWQLIVYELAQLMSDYVPGIHVSQVQMQTGITGINTIRVYSPMKQQADHDPEAIFIKKYLPELSAYAVSDIVNFHTTDLAPYPRPIIDFTSETKIMKDALYAIKQSEIAKLEAKGVLVKHGSRKH